MRVNLAISRKVEKICEEHTYQRPYVRIVYRVGKTWILRNPIYRVETIDMISK